MADVVLRDSDERIHVGKILAVGRNYAEHIAEMNVSRPSMPLVFFKPPSALVADGGVIPLPPGVGQVHHEVEMVAVIGKRGKAIAAKSALDHVLGFAVGLDMTLRDLQNEAKQRGEPWSIPKGFDGAAPVSPVAPREAVGDGSGLEITLDVNGERRQHGNTDRMLHDVPGLVSYLSRWFTLERGDLVFTGTPSGVGPVEPGDVLVARLEQVGSLSVTAVPEPAG